MFKNTLKLASLILLLALSFIYTDKVFSSARSNDPIMKEVMQYKSLNDIKPVEPVIKGNEMIIGYSGLVVNEKESYKNMKKEDKFNKNKIVYDNKLPKETISKTYDYYIKQGNSKKADVSIVFKVDSSDNLDSLLSFVAKNNVSVNFFVDGLWLEDNVETAFSMVNIGSEIYNLGYDGNYDKEYISVTNNLLESISLKDSKYCLNEDKNDEEKNLCKRKKMHSIKPTLIEPSIKELKEGLDKGVMISFDTKNINLSNLSLVLKTITSRGYNVTLLSDLLSENSTN